MWLSKVNIRTKIEYFLYVVAVRKLTNHWPCLGSYANDLVYRRGGSIIKSAGELADFPSKPHTELNA